MALLLGQWQLSTHDHEADAGDVECELCLHAPSLQPAPVSAPADIPVCTTTFASASDPATGIRCAVRNPVRVRGPPATTAV